MARADEVIKAGEPAPLGRRRRPGVPDTPVSRVRARDPDPTVAAPAHRGNSSLLLRGAQLRRVVRAPDRGDPDPRGRRHVLRDTSPRRGDVSHYLESRARISAITRGGTL